MNIKSLIVVLISTITAVACTGKSNNPEKMENSPKAIVCYFSATGTTKTQAQRLADMVDADIHEIVPEASYTAADLDWRNKESRSSVEMNNKTSRPTISNEVDLSDYDVVFIGYPNWWNTAPRIINTFIESNNLSGKTIAPFMTSGGSDITNSAKELKEAYPNLAFAQGLLMNNVSDEEIKIWVAKLNL